MKYMSNNMTAKSLFERDDVRKKFQEILGKKSTAFITSVLQVVAQNSLLAKADPTTIYQAAAVAATLDLPINNNLGFAYIVPYKTRQPDGTFKDVAQFQMGYKGFIQLAQRSGQFKSIYAAPIYDGQILEANPLDGYTFNFTEGSKKSDTVLGYAARFKLLNGYEATFFMTIAQLKAHGAKYSKTFSKGGLWASDFDAMAQKTVLKLLLSKFAPLSVDMQRAVVTDQAVVINAETQEVAYVDNEEQVIDKESERVTLMIQDASTLGDLLKIKEHLKPEHSDLYEEKYSSLQNS